jgi:hypothetical protein
MDIKKLLQPAATRGPLGSSRPVSRPVETVEKVLKA